MEKTITETSFGRRAFLKGTAATLGVAALSGVGCSAQDTTEEGTPVEAPEEQVTIGLCRANCSGGCRLNVHVREGKVVKTSVHEEDNPNDTRICHRGLSHPQRIYAPERIQYPMRRVEGTARGAGEWERLTWDDAIAYIAEKWQGYINEFGGNSIGFSYCAGTYAYNMYVYWRLFHCFGGSIWEQPQDMAALNMGKNVFGRSNYLVGNSTSDIHQAKNIFFWAANATVGNIQRVNDCIIAREQNGAKWITIDPNFTDVAAKSDIWVPVRPGSDGALALAMLKHILDNGKGATREYLALNTVAPYLVKESDGRFLRYSDVGYELIENGTDPRTGQPAFLDPILVMGDDGAVGTAEEIALPVINGTFEVEGVKVTTAYDLLVERVAEWTPEKAAEVTDVPAETIIELADIFADGPSALFLGFGNDHWGNGGTITHCQFALSICGGQFGIPGGGVTGNQGGASVGFNGVNWVGSVMYSPNCVWTSMDAIIEYLPEVLEAGMYKGQPLTMKSMLFAVCNVLATSPDKNALVAALDQLELIITCDTVMNDTARYSDVVLPVPHWFEYETCMSCPTRFMDLNEKAIDPQFESKSDVEICALIGKALGLVDMDITDDSYHAGIFETEACAAAGLSWEALKEQKRIPHAPEDYVYGNIEYGTKCTNTWQRAAFYLEDVVPQFNNGQQLDFNTLRLPSFELPIEGWNETAGGYEKNALAEKYPLIFISYRDKMKVHSTYALCPWFLELQPEPTLMINPVDAQARGIADGDYIRAFNDRGEVVLKAYIDPSMRPGMVKTEHGWMDIQYVKGTLNSLTSDEVRHFVPTGHHFDTLCEVEKYEA